MPKDDARRLGESAVGQVITGMVAGVVFMASIGTVLWMSHEGSVPARPIDEALLQAEAENVLAMLVDSEGAGWTLGPDHVTRLGLKETSGGLSLSKMDGMRGASTLSLLNNLVDYNDGVGSLGFEATAAERVDFHLRVYPVGLDAVLATLDLSSIRTAYIADWTSLVTVTVALDLDPMAMVNAGNVALNATMQVSTAQERAMLTDLGLGYNDRVHISNANPNVRVQVLPGVTSHISTLVPLSLLAGDVYPDIKSYLDAVFVQRLPTYDLLVVGSGVQQSSLTSSPVKFAIRDWVLAGGTLMVLGSSSQNFQWLQPLFSVGTATVNGQAYAPDVSHPILSEPHALAWPSYDNNGISWDIKDQGSGAHWEDFEHIILEDGKDLLAVSLAGAFGEGRIFLTAYQPRAIAAALGFDEARHFLHNMIVYADRDHLFLDYGPPVPPDVRVASAVRHSHVDDVQLGRVMVRAELLVWR